MRRHTLHVGVACIHQINTPVVQNSGRAKPCFSSRRTAASMSLVFPDPRKPPTTTTACLFCISLLIRAL